jgi:hypothetical protein
MSSIDASLTPFAAHWTVRRARDAYLAENGFTVEAYTAPRTEGSFLGIRLSVPNTPHHRWAIMLHDLHHVATGYGTDIVGEGEISGWEIHRSLRPLGLYVGSIVASGLAIGFAIAPRRVAAAWRRGKASRSLYALLADARTPAERDAAYAELLDLTVGDLRARLGLPETGLAPSRRLHDYAPHSGPRAPNAHGA